jgi:ArsR family transcriptional regulator
MTSSEQIIRWLKALGEPTRLRILCLCASSELSGSDLARVLHQSEPRVSRHLRILCDAGLLRRVRQGQWVQYGLTRNKAGAAFMATVLAQLDRNDPLLTSDLQVAHASAVSESGVGIADSRLGRALCGFVAADREAQPIGDALVIGVGHLELLEGVACFGGLCTAVAGSRRAAQAARAFAERRGFHARILSSLSAATPRAGKRFDSVLVDRLSMPHQALPALLTNARLSLRPEGRMWLFERYDSLDDSTATVPEHPLARLRRQIQDAGFVCRRLTPIEADGEHVLAASAA